MEPRIVSPFIDVHLTVQSLAIPINLQTSISSTYKSPVVLFIGSQGISANNSPIISIIGLSQVKDQIVTASLVGNHDIVAILTETEIDDSGPTFEFSPGGVDGDGEGATELRSCL